MNPKVSIIIPNYNHKPFLQERLDSVFNQTFQDFEVIFLDDASIDGSAELLKNYEDHPKVSHLVVNTVNSGSPFKQWQKGIGLAKGDYVWIAESDDYCSLGFLETCLEAFSKNIGIVYTQSVDVDSEGKKISHRINYTACFDPNIWESDFNMKGDVFIAKYLSVKNVIPNASAVVFKRQLVQPQFFNKQLLHMRMCGDWLFWLQLVNQTYISFINKDLNYFRHHKQVSRNHQDVNKKKKRIIEEVIIRDYLKVKQGVENTIADKTLERRWFNLHAKNSLFGSEFYKLRSSFNGKFQLALQFMYFKLKS